MFMQDVSSSFIAAVGQEPAPGTQNLLTVRIRFNHGREYEYNDVDPEDYQALMDAPSIGSHFHSTFKRKYVGAAA